MISIPIHQSFRFRPITTGRQTFDNTFARETDSFPYSYEHFLPEQSVKFQIVTKDLHSVVNLIHDGTTTEITAKTTSTIGAYTYETYTVNLALYVGQCCYFEAFSQVTTETPLLTHRSEPFQVATKLEYLLIEWFNSDNNLMDYSTGLTHVLQIEAKQWKMQPAGESSVYVNQGQETKLKGITNRIFLLECELPAYLADILTGATDQDRFYINEVEYIVSKKPTLTQYGQSDMYQFSCELTQKTIIGVNTHDVG